MSSLAVNIRTALGKAAGALRRRGIIPGVVYGHNVKNVAVAVDEKAFMKVYRQVGETTLFDLVINGQTPVKVLVQEVQRHPVSGTIQHIDFHQVRMDEMLEVDIPFKYVGESPAVKELGGVLVRIVNELKVKCLPQDLVHEIEVDLGNLKEFNDSITLKEIGLPKGMEVLSPGVDEVLATVMPPRSESELAELKAEIKEDVEAVKVEERGRIESEGGGEPKTKAEAGSVSRDK